MLFFQFSFLFVFLPLVLALDRLARGRPAHNHLLLGASLLFYAASSWEYLPILAVSIGVDYLAAQRIHATDDPRRRRAWLAASMGTNLALLGAFKYAGLITTTLRGALGDAVPLVSLPLPVGISFYTFQSMSYTIDIYRRAAAPAPSLARFATFVLLFPQLIAGPIVRWVELAAELERRDTSAERFARGLRILVGGLAQKIVLADSFAALADPLIAQPSPGLVGAWVAMIAYAGQIYFDFSGYSDMAVGMGHMLGFTFPQNFRDPYRATSFSDFWRRWHITLSTWLRDYLYVPLGGNRRGRARTYLNLIVTMLLGGLWHGASWSFLAWGALHGAYLAAERALAGRVRVRAPTWARRALVFAAVVWAWVPFRADDWALTLRLWRAMLGLDGLGAVTWLPAAGAAAVLVLVWGLPRERAAAAVAEPAGARALGWTAALLVLSILLAYGRLEAPPFLYFRF